MTDLARLRSLDGIKWAKYPEPVLASWVADMDFEPAPAITSAIRGLIDRGDLGYNMAVGDALGPAWARWQSSRHGWSPPETELRPFTGALHALEVAMVTATEPGDGVVIMSPIYSPFRSSILDSGRRVIDVPLDPDGWRINGDRLASAIDDGTRMILMCQPHNPTGRVFDDVELSAVAAVAHEHDLLVISDEIWADLVLDPVEHRPLVLSDDRFQDRLVTIGSASKPFNLAGLRCAVAHIGSAKFRDALDALPRHVLGAPSTLSAAAALAAWGAGNEWLADTRAAIAARHEQLAVRLAAELPEVAFVAPEATYLAWLDMSGTGLGMDPAQRLLEEVNLAVEPGEKFGGDSEQWVRLNVATSEQILDAVIDRMVAAAGAARRA